MHDEFIAIGKLKNKAATGTSVHRLRADGVTYFSTTVVAPRDMTACASPAPKPAKVWLNGEAVTGSTLKLKAGANPLVLQLRPSRAAPTLSLTTGSNPALPRPGATGDEMVEPTRRAAV